MSTEIKIGDLVAFRGFPPIALGFGANPKCGIVMRFSKPRASVQVIVVLFGDKEYRMSEARLEVISRAK